MSCLYVIYVRPTNLMDGAGFMELIRDEYHAYLREEYPWTTPENIARFTIIFPQRSGRRGIVA